MPAVLGGRVEVDTRVPAPGEFLDRRHVDHAVVQVRVEFGHVARYEPPVGRDRVAAQRHLPRLLHVMLDVREHGLARLGERDAARQVGEQPGRRVHVPHDVAYLIDSLGWWLDDQVDPAVEQIQLPVGHDARDLDQRVPLDVEPRHLAVDPYQPVVHPHKDT